MEEKMDQLIALIQKDEKYQDFKQKEKDLLKVESILMEHSKIMEEYQSLKQYEAYIDSSSIKEKLKAVKQKMATTPEIVAYYQSYHQLNDFLDEITQIIFGDLNLKLNTSLYQLGR